MLFRGINKTFLFISFLIFILPSFTMAETYTIDPLLSYVTMGDLFRSSDDPPPERIALSGSLNFSLTDNLYDNPSWGIVNIDTGGIQPKDIPLVPFQSPYDFLVNINGANFFELNPCYFGGWCMVDPFGEFIEGTLSGPNLELKGSYTTPNFYHYFFNIEASATTIPEPATLLLLGLGGMGLAGIWRKFKKQLNT